MASASLSVPRGSLTRGTRSGMVCGGCGITESWTFWLFFDDTVRGVWCAFKEHTGRGWVLLFYFPSCAPGAAEGPLALGLPTDDSHCQAAVQPRVGSCASSPRGLPACCALQKLQEEEEEEESNTSKAPTTVSEDHV